MKAINEIQAFTSDGSPTKYSMWYSPDKLGRMFSRGEIYERHFLEWIREQRFTGTALDIGGNIGTHALWMHFICGLDVIAFEPVIPHVIRANAHLNGVLDNGIWVHDYALGDKQGFGFHVAKGEIRTGKSDQSTDETFQIWPLDAIESLPQTSFWKIDVEGFEAAVLRGAVKTITRDRPVIATEEWTAVASAAVAAVLKPLGYRASEHFGGKGKAPMVVWRP